MKRNLRGAAALLLACVLLLLAACGAPTAEEEDNAVVGGDWRTWGLVQSSAQVDQDGTVYGVLLCVYDDEAVLYLDDETQTPVGLLVYPEPVEQAASNYNGSWFEDENGDGCTDVTLEFWPAGAHMQTLTWYWDTDESAYILQESAEDAAPDDSAEDCGTADCFTSEAALDTLAGLWAFEDGTRWLEIGEDWEWSISNVEGDILNSGHVFACTDGSFQLLPDSEDDEEYWLTPESADTLRCEDGTLLVRCDA